MRLMLLAAAFLAASSGLAAPRQPGQPQSAALPVITPAAEPEADCPETPASLAAGARGPARAFKLDELPPANAYAAVYRKIDGCEAPVVVRYNIRGDR